MTPQELQQRLAEASDAHRQRVQQFMESGDQDRFGRALAMAYETFSVANAYAEEAVALAERHGFNVKKIKTKANNLAQSFDAFDKVIFSMFGDNQSAKSQLCNDFDTLRAILDTYRDHKIEVKTGHYFKPTLFLPDQP